MRQILDNAKLVFPTLLGYVLYSTLDYEAVQVDPLISSTGGAF